jgi:hypothetical protein
MGTSFPRVIVLRDECPGDRRDNLLLATVVARYTSRCGGRSAIIGRMRRRTWWATALGAALLALYCGGLLVRIRCTVLGSCGGPARFFDLDSLGGVPRLATTTLFLVSAVLAWRASRLCSGRRAMWWVTIALIGAGLALLKLLSVHSVAKADSPILTLLGSVLLTGIVLGGLWGLGRRWDVPATRPVVLALALYASAAVGLDAGTWLFAAVQSEVGALSEAAATFVEELGEALTALVLLVTVREQSGTVSSQSVRQQ